LISAYNTVSKTKYDITNGAFGQKESAYEQQHKSKISEMKRMINEKQDSNNKPKSVIEQSLSYRDSLRASRSASKNTLTELKQLKYNSKSISSQIRQSKTSVNARRVASAARREVVQLKMKLRTGKYDEEELMAAIEHAKSMERVAKKKARHLEEEEMIKISDRQGYDMSAAELEQELEEEAEKTYEEYDEEIAMKQAEAEAATEEQIAEIEAEIAESIDEIQQMVSESMEDFSEDMYEMLAETMEDALEETLSDIADSMLSVTDYEMNEDEFKAFKIKHRSSEDKSMIEADSKYLKALFDIYDKRMGGSNANIQGVISDVSAGISASSSGNMSTILPNIVDISV